mmetsp:Transcript_126810/g.224655  ORF Transcript_126810/g.224655 Transcript_126810/m.224655 type:complete len:564 (+) Transcript_126810:2-1693(+)
MSWTLPMGSGFQCARGRYRAASPETPTPRSPASSSTAPAGDDDTPTKPANNQTSPQAQSPTPSVAELKRRLRDLGQEAPASIVEKSELRALVEAAERQHAQPGSPDPRPPSLASPSTPSSVSPRSPATGRSSPMRTVAQLKKRLRELGLEIPVNVVEKAELVALVEEADRNHVNIEPATPTGPTKVAKSGRSVAALKSRLQELGVEVPAGVVEKRELVMLIEEAERKQGLDSYGSQAFRKEAVESEKVDDSVKKREDSNVSCRRLSTGVVQISIDAADNASPPFVTETGGGVIVRGAHFTWLKGKLIGRGSLGLVFQAKDQASGRIMAVKEVFISSSDNSDTEFRTAMENEISIMRDLKHPNVVSYLGHDYIEDRFYVYMDYMPGGSLERVLKDNGPLDESLLAKYTQQLLCGLDYLHGQTPPLLHRDIKCANVLIRQADLVKLADFGCSKRTEDTKTQTMLRGSIPWMAPEVVANSRYSPASDIWSFGCTVIEMGTARLPWGAFENQVAALIKIGMSSELPPLPEGVSEACQDFILQCVQRDPSRRPSAGELLKHGLVASFT